MIAGLSKAATLYLTPALALTAVLLSLFAFLAPAVMLQDRVALLTVTPSNALFPGQSTNVDGPSVFLGTLGSIMLLDARQAIDTFAGSCSRHTNSAPVNCTLPTVSPAYDLSALPGNAPSLLLSPPAPSSAVFIAVAISFSALFFFMFTATSFRHKMGEKVSSALDRPLIQRLSAWIGVFAFMIGLTSFAVIRMWFGKAVQDFNNFIVAQGNNGPKLLAEVGNGFTMVWVAYAFHAAPLVVALAKLNVKATKA
ncbi:hypothetical protein M378DRAFT_175175 [Amanita muscaria Koide BX008]|uniref:Uncharacterized protein n=1 Tax=Amanita muscaria (strain Koide BX008) TaxID=946122 RepID=A0A0C2X8T0_AMAMK|nr:hypothetical protein M378DRAFT_175175 [Amanita muscaria Koide BX008]